MISREAIYSALFAKLTALKTAGTVVTASRRLEHWNDVDAGMQPAVYQQQGLQTPEKPVKGGKYKWDFTVNIYVYVRVADDADPGPVLNPILDAIENALTPLPAIGLQNLGGACHDCYIDGAIETFEGTLGNQEVAIIPIKILVR